jgi:diguanylate cyclase (GGDEF)-like protein
MQLNNNLKTIGLILILLLSTQLSANLEVDYRFRLLNTEHGLPSVAINTIFQQSNGYIWIGTDRGVSRYDGYEFEHYSYSPGAPNHISNNFIISIIEDKEGNLWIGTEDGLNRIDPTGSITIYKQGDSADKALPSYWITALFEDDDGSLWVGTGYGLFHFEPNEHKVTEYSVQFEHNKKTSASVHSIVKLSTGEIIVAATIGVGVINQESATILPYLRANSSKMVYPKYATKLLIYDDASLLIATETEGLIIYNPQTGGHLAMKHSPKRSGLLSNSLTDLLKDEQNNLWIGYENHGVSVHDMSQHKVRHLSKREFEPYSLPSNTIVKLFVDKSGLVWVGTSDGIGLYSHLTQGTKIYFKRPDGTGLTSNDIYHFFKDDNSRVWVASEQGLMQLDEDGNIFKNFPLIDTQKQPFASQEIWRIAQADNSKLWLATENGLLLFDPNTGTCENISEQSGLPKRAIYTLQPTEDNGVWVTGYMDLGLIKLNGNRKIEKHLLNDSNSSYWEGGNFSFAKIRTSDGALMLATTDGVFRVNQDDSVNHYPLSQDQAFIRATSIIEVTSTEFWIATQGLGIVKLTIDQDLKPEYRYFNQATGFPTNEVKALALESKHIWFTTKNQVFKIDRETEEVEAFPNLFNIPQLSFTENGMAKFDDKLYLASSRGFLSIDTNRIRRNTYQSPVRITNVVSPSENKLNSAKNLEDGIVELSYEDNDIEFSFASLDYTNPSNTRYSYKLEGVNNTWSEPSNRRTVSYNNLGFGRYTFKVKGTNSGGLWNSEQSEFTFVVLKPWWFYLIIASLSITLITLILYLLDRRKRIVFLHEKAHTDTLTRVANRFSFNEKLAATLDLDPKKFGLAIIDLDGFKEINDSFGHHVGDTFLIETASRIRASIRPSDFIARLGGDEFALIMNKYKSMEDVIAITERIRDSISQPYKFSDTEVAASCSVGVAIYPQDGADSVTLLTHADAAMYESKNSGKNKVFFFNQSLSQTLSRKLKIRALLKMTLKNDEFTLYYQPKYNQFTNELIGAEALIRWIHPEEGFIPPDEFIKEAELNATILDIGEWVLIQACQQAKKWQDQYQRDCPVSINVSPVQIANAGFVELVSNALRETKVDPKLIELEITESVLIESREQSQEIFTALQALGVTIALDDFGVGFSSLSYLTQFSIDTLKIDRSFVKGLSSKNDNYLVLKNIYSLAQDLNMAVVAEGVEDKNQLQIIASFGGALIQGYYYSPPLPPEQFEELFAPTDS